MNIPQLNEKFGYPPFLNFIEGPGGLPIAEIFNDQAFARISLYGAHVLSFKPIPHDEVLWVSKQSLYEQGKAIRGGIPVCWPWFGPHATDASKPSHGIVRTALWNVIATDCESSERTGLRLAIKNQDSSQGLWPYPFDLVLDMTVAKSLNLSLTMRNNSSQKLPYSFALHTYFTVADVTKIVIQGLDGVKYIDRTDKDALKKQNGHIQIAGEVDRSYLDTHHACTIEDSGMHRKISISKTDSNTTVVWNPWSEKAKKMKDFGDDEYTSMVCVESANAFKNSVELEPGEQFCMKTSISAEMI